MALRNSRKVSACWPEHQGYTKALPFNDLERSREIIRQNRNDLAAIILEPVIGEGGFVPASLDYLKMLRSETEKLGALLIFDEVITGFRVSLNGAQGRFGITPDLTTLGKIAGGGFPVGAVVGKKEILEKTSPERKVKKAGEDPDRRRNLLVPSFDRGCRGRPCSAT